MKRSTIMVAILTFSLVGSDAWWAYKLVDAGVTATYREVSFDDHRRALVVALAVLPVAAQADATPAQVIATAQAASGDEPFEKNGLIWVDRLGFKFDTDGRLVEVEAGWQPF